MASETQPTAQLLMASIMADREFRTDNMLGILTAVNWKVDNSGSYYYDNRETGG